MNEFRIIILLSSLFLFSCTEKKALYSTPEYELFNDKVVQDEYEARAVTSTEIISNYVSESILHKSPVISFKFCINGFDNEMTPGSDHSYSCIVENGDSVQIPLIKFGEQLIEKRGIPKGEWLPANTHVIFRVDMSMVFDSFEKQGFYITKTGKKIFTEDFKGVYLAGSIEPLTWDIDNLPGNEGLKMKDVGNHIYELNLIVNPVNPSQLKSKSWKLSKDISAFPHYESDFVLENALYNLSLEEMCNAIEPDSTLRTGKEWAGVWTRDVSYSIILSMAHLQPVVSMKSLMKKVNANGRIIQDTGTGGAWPVSSDRMIWAVAAFEIYKVTGNREWLKLIYPIIRNSVEDDLKTVIDNETGLVKGESSFLDWREQEYPRWMQPADIFESVNLGTSAVHCKAIGTLGEIADIIGDSADSERYKSISDLIKSGINKYLWIEKSGFYGQYLYGRNSMLLSPRSETLGEALCVLFDIADEERAERVISNVPSLDFGTPCFFPNIADIPPYHNDGIWPFVQSYWMWASAKAGNEKGVMHSIGAIYRASALFLTNQENFVDYSGDWFGTQINSANMLWSLSGNISVVHHLLFGIRFNNDGISFEPFVPKVIGGERKLKNFKYRESLLNIELSGWGNAIESFYLDGVEQKPFLKSDLKGVHNIKIVLACKNFTESKIKIVENQYPPLTPVISLNDGKLSWEKLKGVKSYKVICNGKIWKNISRNQVFIADGMEGEFQIIAVGENGFESFASEPVSNYKNIKIIEAEDFAYKSSKVYKDFSGNGFVEISHDVNKKISVSIDISKTGNYSLDWRYANGNGPVNTENKCAIRSLFVNGDFKGVQVFPQRGINLWNSWGWSNPVILELKEGKNQINLEFMPYNENMNILVNNANLDYLRVIKVTH